MLACPRWAYWWRHWSRPILGGPIPKRENRHLQRLLECRSDCRQPGESGFEMSKMIPHTRIVLKFRVQEIIGRSQLIFQSCRHIYATSCPRLLWPYQSPIWIAGDYSPLQKWLSTGPSWMFSYQPLLLLRRRSNPFRLKQLSRVALRDGILLQSCQDRPAALFTCSFHSLWERNPAKSPKRNATM